MRNPTVYIIILNWNKIQDTIECLDSVFKLDYPNFEVIVVDNGSIDDSAGIIKKTYERVILIQNNANLGYTGGNNIGMHYAMECGADYLWLLNNDAVVEKDSLSKIVNMAERESTIGLVSPVIHYFNDQEKIQFCGSYIEWDDFTIQHLSETSSWKEKTTGETFLLWGTALLIKRRVIEKIGYLDDRLFAYWEDTDYSLRSIEAGYQNCLCTEARVFHKAPIPVADGIKRSDHYYYYIARNRYLLGDRMSKSVRRSTYIRKYLWHILDSVCECKSYKADGAAEVCIDGAWAAFCGITGPMDMSVRAPAIVKKVFIGMSSWHPSFWSSILRHGVIKTIFQKVGIKINKDARG